MTDEQQAEAIRRAAELSVDHISAWFATGTGSTIFQSMRQEIERNMTAALEFTERCQSDFKDTRIAELEEKIRWHERTQASEIAMQKSLHTRISQLEEQLKPFLTGTAFAMWRHKVDLLVALLDRVPHVSVTPGPANCESAIKYYGGTGPCVACELEKLKEGK